MIRQAKIHDFGAERVQRDQATLLITLDTLDCPRPST